MKYELYNADCLEKMKDIPDKSIDCIITDPPYGTTACKWDSVIPFDKMWEQLNRIIKDNGAIVLFGSEPFSSMLRCSNLKMFRYDLVWDKERGYGFANANKMPMKSHEIISIFYKKLPVYNPQKTKGKPYKTNGGMRKNIIKTLRDSDVGGDKTKQCACYRAETINNGDRFPLSIIKFKRDNDKFHPTQKPVSLLEYLIKTYTLENETVLDFTMGSGSTGVACVNTNRSFIGIELDTNYFNIAKKRIEDAGKEKASELNFGVTA